MAQHKYQCEKTLQTFEKQKSASGWVHVDWGLPEEYVSVLTRVVVEDGSLLDYKVAVRVGETTQALASVRTDRRGFMTSGEVTHWAPLNVLARDLLK